jgi:hypothetical protein
MSMRDLQQVYTFANRIEVERRGEVLRLIASTPTVAAIASPTVEPTTAISVVTMVSETSVVTARRPASAASSATTTGAQNEACDHGDHDYRHNYKEHPHPNSPFTGFPDSRFDLREAPPYYNDRCKRRVCRSTNVCTRGSYTLGDTQRDNSQRCDEWTRRRSL